MDEGLAQRGNGKGRSRPTYALIDGNSVYSRAFFAAESDRNEEARDSLEEISLSILLPVFDPGLGRIESKISGALWCWDTAPKKDKKRSPKPPGFEDGLFRFVEMIDSAIGGSHSMPEGYEADDQVATAAMALSTEDCDVILVSSDKDLHQLASGNARYYCLNSKSILSRHSILERWHVKRPIQSAIALAILGDKGDNIQGIKGWGEKKVQKLFSSVTPEMTLDEALETIVQQIPEDKLGAFYESLELTFLNSDVPDVPRPSPLTFPKLDRETIQALKLERCAGALARLRSSYSGESDVEDFSS